MLKRLLLFIGDHIPLSLHELCVPKFLKLEKLSMKVQNRSRQAQYSALTDESLDLLSVLGALKELVCCSATLHGLECGF